VLALIGYLRVSVNQLTNVVPEYISDFEISTGQLEDYFAQFNIDISAFTDLEFLDPAILIGIVGGFISSIGKALGNATFAILVFVFMLLEATNFPARLKAGFLGDDPRFARLINFNKDVREYVKITTYAGMLAGAADALLLFVLGVDFPILWGILAWLLGYIPSLGFWLAMIPPTILAWLAYGWQRALLVVIGYILINGGEENLLKPRIMERGLNLSALITVLSVFLWGWILGPLGAILAIPLTMAVQKLILEPYDETRWLADLMGAGSNGEGEEAQVYET
jgi:predicted PurR-regulated permease PerM